MIVSSENEMTMLVTLSFTTINFWMCDWKGKDYIPETTWCESRLSDWAQLVKKTSQEDAENRIRGLFLIVSFALYFLFFVLRLLLLLFISSIVAVASKRGFLSWLLLKSREWCSFERIKHHSWRYKRQDIHNKVEKRERKEKAVYRTSTQIQGKTVKEISWLFHPPLLSIPFFTLLSRSWKLSSTKEATKRQENLCHCFLTDFFSFLELLLETMLSS